MKKDKLDDWEKRFNNWFMKMWPALRGSSFEGALQDYLENEIQQERQKAVSDVLEKLGDNYWLARVFHNEYEGLAEKYGWNTRKNTRVEFDKLPPENMKLMLATCKLVLWHIRSKIKEMKAQPVTKKEADEKKK
jgi:CRISPR/Cas system CMR subunit Cmr4 (Cas7 group RAMP superfamily)